MNSQNLSVKKLINTAAERLKDIDCESPLIEAEWLLLHVLQWKRADLWLRGHEIPSAEIVKSFEEAMQQRLKGRPVQYICGDTEFFGHIFKVGEGVLIPRPETEILVENALNFLKEKNGDVLDLCTGSGAIILSILLNDSQHRQYHAVDICDKAYSYAKSNSDSLLSNEQKKSFQLLKGDLFKPLPEDKKYKLIVSNPPYVTEEEYAELAVNVKEFEPKLALTADDNGMAILKRLAEISPGYLEADGMIICEMGDKQGPACLDSFGKFFNEVKIIKDYTGRDRFVKAMLPK